MVAVIGLVVAVVNVALTLIIWWDVRDARARLGDGDGRANGRGSTV